MHRDLYLEIEPVPDHSPLAPTCRSRRDGNDSMRKPGNERARARVVPRAM